MNHPNRYSRCRSQCMGNAVLRGHFEFSSTWHQAADWVGRCAYGGLCVAEYFFAGQITNHVPRENGCLR
eukprot:2425094-Amphidinium_carterae.1